MRKAILVLVLAALAPVVHAQTVSPVVSEYGKKASGSFTVTNNALTPVSVVVEPQSFTVSADGKAAYRPLDTGVEVRLSESSSRLGPKQSRTFDYDIKCASLPCTVTFWSVVTGLHTDSGIAMAVHLPAVVYICGKANNCRKETRKTWGVVE